MKRHSKTSPAIKTPIKNLQQNKFLLRFLTSKPKCRSTVVWLASVNEVAQGRVQTDSDMVCIQCDQTMPEFETPILNANK